MRRRLDRWASERPIARFYDRPPCRPTRPHDDLASIWGRVTDELSAGLPRVDVPALDRAARADLRSGRDAVRRGARGDSRLGRAPLRELACRARCASRAEASSTSCSCAGDRRARESPDRRWTTRVESLPVDPLHTFERFVIGDGNRLAHAAALAVAELPGEAYNPLFLHGPPGLGKTHLLGAIVDYLRRHRPDLIVHYTTAERFTTEFVTALRKDGPERFKERYRELDALLIDDVQALEGKDHTQEEFVHTFNALHAAGKQIVLSSDRPPEALARLAERLRDRFQWGLSHRARAARSAHPHRTLVADGARPRRWRSPSPPSCVRSPALPPATSPARRRHDPGDRPLLRARASRSLPDSSSGPSRAPSRSDHRDGPDQTIHPASSRSRRPSAPSSASPDEDLLSPKRTSRVSQARQLAIYLAVSSPRYRSPRSRVTSTATTAPSFTRSERTSGAARTESETSSLLERIRGHLPSDQPHN